MCSSILQAPFKLASKVTDKVDPMSWYLRKQGWAGGINPSQMLTAKLGNVKTKTDKLAETINNPVKKQPDRTVSGQSGLGIRG